MRKRTQKDNKQPNPRIDNKDYAAIKGALRRAFSRSKLRNSCMDKCRIEHYDEERPRVRKWGYCNNPECGMIVPFYTITLDHSKPIIDVTSSMKEMSLDELVDRIWCEEDNLVPLCEPCHTAKTKLEMQQRREYKKSQKATK